jgi:hypothetical protein
MSPFTSMIAAYRDGSMTAAYRDGSMTAAHYGLGKLLE